jgi:hypothetical protein
VEAAICAAEKARRPVRARSVAALFIITFLLAGAGIPVVVDVSAECAILDTLCCSGTRTAFDLVPDERLVSKIEHELIYTHNGIKIGNMQLKNKEILLRAGCGISGK